MQQQQQSNDLVVSNDFETVQTTTMHGVVKWYNQSGKYGVIKTQVDNSDQFKEYFVFVDETHDKLYDGIEVIFDAGYDQIKKRDIATNVAYRPGSSVNKEVLHKINKIDIRVTLAASWNDVKVVHDNEMIHVLNTLPPDLPDTFSDMFTELMELVTISDSLDSTKLAVREIASRGVHKLVFDCNTQGSISLGSCQVVPGCLNHTNDMLVSELSKRTTDASSRNDREPCYDCTPSNMKVEIINSLKGGACVIFEHRLDLNNVGMVMLTSFGVSTDVIFSSKHNFTKMSVTMHHGNSVLLGSDVMTDWSYMIKYPPLQGNRLKNNAPTEGS